MFGFIIGTVCLIALVSTLRHQYGFAWGGGCGGRAFGRFGGPPWRGAVRHRRQQWFMRRLFEQLETTPGQEKVIVKHVDNLIDNMATNRHELSDVRREVAQVLRGESLDEASLQAALAKVEDLLAKTKQELTQALTEIHASLEPDQRRDLADLLTYGPSRRRDYGRRF
jgi:Spy/CpxP family protein refolding chaperone